MSPIQRLRPGTIMTGAISATLLATLLAAAPVYAATSYVAVASGAWDDAATWDGGMPPITTHVGDAILIPSGIAVTVPAAVVVTLDRSSLSVDGSITNHGEIHVNVDGILTVSGSLNTDGLLEVEGGYNADQTVFGTARLNVSGTATISGGTLLVRPWSEMHVEAGGNLDNEATTSLSINTVTRVYGTFDNAGELGLDFVSSFKPFVAQMIITGGLVRNLAGAHIQLDGTIGLGGGATLSRLENHGTMDLPRSNEGRGHLINGSGLARIDNYGTINLADTMANTQASDTISNHQGAVINVALQSKPTGDLLGRLAVGPGLLENDGLIANSGLIDNTGGGQIDQLCDGSITGNAVTGDPPVDACDVTPPVVVPTVTGTLGGDGWYTSDVEISWSVSDPESDDIDLVGCSTETLTVDTDGYTAECAATSIGGTTEESVTVKRDATGPAITFSGNLGQYGLMDTVAIGCDATDDLSGTASATCPTVNGPAWSFALDTPNDLDATATDLAGNEASASTSFSVVVTAEGLHGLVDAFTESALVRSVLHRDLDWVVAASPKKRAGKVRAFERYVLSKAGKGDLTQDEAQVLITAVRVFVT